ncbi:hybrid sensor histidine kinase/response regulator [Crocosphaera chwakensis]|uniref:histidine kinase n=1 Tax=Crocosphaera chwakensis CCY0110 TaxID=391612 RepID=A3ITF7_9CHRO|nr:ATP-binding protein [Crocosphaera chwakensis]EAZ90242.1 two-component hybrid sensor and regulator [Crocosphaera chwakensis CCY0110]
MSNTPLSDSKEDYLQLALRAGRFGAWQLELPNKNLITSIQCKADFGRTPDDEFTYDQWLNDSIHPDDRDRVQVIIETAIALNEDYEAEYRVIHPDGSLHWVLGRGRIIDHVNGQPNRMIGITVDITEQKQAQLEKEQLLAQQKRSSERYRFLSEISILLSSSLDDYKTTLNRVTHLAVPIIADWCFIDLIEDDQVNRVSIAYSDPHQSELAKEVLKYPPENNLYDPPAKVLFEQKSLLISEFTDEMISKATKNLEHEKVIQKTYPLSLMAVPLVARQNTLGVITFVTTGYSNRRLTTEDLAIAEEIGRRAAQAVDNAWLYHQAQIANRAKDDFLAMLSHELRTPLNPIIGWCELLNRGNLSPEQTKQAVEIIDRNAKLQSHLIEDLLDVSRILQGKLHLQKCSLDLKTIILSAIETVQLMAKKSSVTIETKLDTDVHPISGDITRLHQVVWNLLSNAIKFSPSHSTVTVSLSAVDGMALIEIKDQGKGIEPEFLPYIFDRFSQSESSKNRDYGGLGLGLTIVRNLVEMHDGKIKADSLGINQGATFTVAFPILYEDKKTVTDEEPKISTLTNLEGIKVLIVDDEPDSLNLLVCVFQSQKAHIKAVMSGFEALEIVESFQPNILISDINMPLMSGHDLLHKIQSLFPTLKNKLLAIAFSANASESDIEKSLKVGFIHHLVKPININDIINILVQEIKKKSLN